METHRGQRLEETHSDEQGTRRERQQRDSAQIANAQRKKEKKNCATRTTAETATSNPPTTLTAQFVHLATIQSIYNICTTSKTTTQRISNEGGGSVREPEPPAARRPPQKRSAERDTMRARQDKTITHTDMMRARRESQRESGPQERLNQEFRTEILARTTCR